MPEGESEIIGYFVEYWGMKFGMFVISDFLEVGGLGRHDDRAVPGWLAGAVSPGLGLRVPLGRLTRSAAGASIMGVVMVYGSLDMQDIARAQGLPLLPKIFGNWIPAWGVLTQPLAFLLFLTAGIAATKRIPFDTPEGESEIIGYFVEYSGMKFGMFAMADFLETVVVAGMTTALFLGGWQVRISRPRASCSPGAPHSICRISSSPCSRSGPSF